MKRSILNDTSNITYEIPKNDAPPQFSHDISHDISTWWRWNPAARPMERLDVAAATCAELIERIPSNGSELEARRRCGKTMEKARTDPPFFDGEVM